MYTNVDQNKTDRQREREMRDLWFNPIAFAFYMVYVCCIVVIFNVVSVEVFFLCFSSSFSKPNENALSQNKGIATK